MEMAAEFLPLPQIIKMVRKKELSPCSLLERLLMKIDEFDPEINSYARINENALKECAIKKKQFEFPVPVSVKDLFNTRGIETNYGSEIFAKNFPEKDAVSIKNIKRNGGIIVGKTVTHEFALGITSQPTKNPWDLKRIPGGSSGGSAAAVSAGLAVFATGSDTGGSIRIPAAMCGVTGFKPTYSLIPKSGIFPESWSLDHAGAITRYAGDLKLELEMMIGKPIPEVKKEHGKFRVGVAWDLFNKCWGGVKDISSKALDRIQSELNLDYADIEPENLLFEEMQYFHEIIDTTEIAATHRANYEKYPWKYLDSSKRQIEHGLNNRAVEYVEAKRKRQKLKLLFDSNFSSLDVVIIPVLQEPAPPIVAERDNNEKGEEVPYVDFLSPLNYSGNPAMSIPIGLSEGLPVGLQIVGKNHSDSVCIDFATLVQDHTEWHKLIPPRYAI